MEELNLRTLAIAVECVELEKRRLGAHCKSLDEDDSETGNWWLLHETYVLAAKDLEKAYRIAQKGIINFPTYEDLIASIAAA